MKPTKTNHSQGRLGQAWLSEQLKPNHELYVLAEKIDWDTLETEFSGVFSSSKGAPGKPVRLVVGLLMLEHMYGLSDEDVVYTWVENPYWQFFCGYDFFQWNFPIDPSSLSRWRKRLGSQGMEKILKITVQAALRTGTIMKSSLKKAIIDATIMPKNITYPTDSKLYYRGIQTLVRMANRLGIKLRQTYTFLAKRAARKASTYAHARQMNRSKREQRRLKSYLGRLYRDVERQIKGINTLEAISSPILKVIEQLLAQERESKNKIYSIHEPKVECISKGKPHKRYEFGCKASLVVTHKEGFALGVQALHGNPYDGHTLKDVLERAERITGSNIQQAFVDKGYRGHSVEGKQVFISGQKKGVSRWIKKQINRRQAIEPHIGHMKMEGKLERNFLKGVIGDEFNSILCGVGHNLRMILRHICRLASPQPVPT